MEYIKNNNIPIDNDIASKIANKYSMNSSIVELLIARGINTEQLLDEYIVPSLSNLYDPYLMKNMDSVVQRISHHIKADSKILIFGDYDADGISATAIMVKLFKELDKDVHHYIPNRYEDGYGLTIDTIDKVLATFDAEVIITVDCGITAIEECKYLQGKGIEIIITDHHEPMETLPDCLILNPKICDYPSRDLCGAGVALKLVQAMGIDIEPYLPIAAIATIADIVEMIGENRVIVSFGLKYFSLAPLGLQMLLQKNDIVNRAPKSNEIAFKIAPKINASGRMGDAEKSFQLFIEEDKDVVTKIIEDIYDYNIRRQAMCSEIYDEVKQQLSDKNIFNIKCIVAKSTEWNAGILGIVAAKLSEEYNRPTFIFAEVDGVLTGSGRSVNGVNIHNMLSGMSDLFVKFGGHTMAAGMTLKVENYETFVRESNEYVLKNFANADLTPIRHYDLSLSADVIDYELLKSIQMMEPTGHKNHNPLVLMNADKPIVVNMKNHYEHLIIKYKTFSLLAFNSLDHYFTLKENKSTKIITELILDQYKGKPKLSGIVKSIDYTDVYRPEDEDVLLVHYLSQIKCYSHNTAIYDRYTRSDLVNMILQMRSEIHGTLIIANDYNSYINFKKIYDNTNIAQDRMFSLLDSTGLNTILLAPKNFDNFDSYSRIIFLDPMINLAYVGLVNKKTNAKIYLPYKKNQHYNVLSKLKLTRDVFVQYYKLFEKLASQKIKKNNEYELYQSAKTEKINGYNYLQFMCCYYVFDELKLLKMDYYQGVSIKMNDDCQADLSKSIILRKLKNMI